MLLLLRWINKIYFIFTNFIVSIDFSYKNVSEIPVSNDEVYKLNENDDIQDVYNKLFKVMLTLKKQNMNLYKENQGVDEEPWRDIIKADFWNEEVGVWGV